MDDCKNNTNDPGYSIDMSKNKYRSRYDRLLNILYYSKELPCDLYRMMDMSYCNYRKTVSILKQRKLIRKISTNNTVGYSLTHEARRLTKALYYIKYADSFEDQRGQYDIKHRNRKRQFAYLYALFDRAGIPYERFAKPPLTTETVKEDSVYFYTALDIKMMMGINATSFKGSRVLGFLIGKGRVITVYRTNRMMRNLGSQEALVPMLLLRFFGVTVDIAVLICDDAQAAIDITRKINDNIRNDPSCGVNTSKYRYFYVLPSDDSFLSHFEDLYADHSKTVQRIIDKYDIDTADTDSGGNYRIKVGTGFVGDSQILVCAGNVNSVALKYFVRQSDFLDSRSYIICDQRDIGIIEETVKGKHISVIAI